MPNPELQRGWVWDCWSSFRSRNGGKSSSI